ncbi:hypothetical protein WG66_008281 [Moniliophthora roreri]|nr:hypothetical protein WG66_008281 [Moniliophthora roreri]
MCALDRIMKNLPISPTPTQPHRHTQSPSSVTLGCNSTAPDQWYDRFSVVGGSFAVNEMGQENIHTAIAGFWESIIRV